MLGKASQSMIKTEMNLQIKIVLQFNHKLTVIHANEH